MWLLFIEIVASIVAAIRGWGFLPIGLVLGSVIIGLLLGITIGDDSYLCMSVIDWILTISLAIMAIIGKKKKTETRPEETQNDLIKQNRIKCPRCAELIMPDAKICRFCGYEFPNRENE